MTTTTKHSDRPNTFDDRCVLFFVKYPESGQIKSRLAASLAAINIVELYRHFVLDLLAMLEPLAIPFYICYFQENKARECKAWLGENHSYLPQQGNDLGGKMKHCFTHAFSQGFDRVITIGSDSPDLPSYFITEAFSSITTMDSVIGPAFDGGYYLIGFRKETFFPEAFTGIRWSTDKVFEESLAKLKNAGHKTYILPPWHDIDSLGDLKNLIQRGRQSPFKNSKTMSFLTTNPTVRENLL
ncbi:MAG: TIGR04282 family arsenosugar biosynthesis glycosyltransferase [Thermodesulfobacteriota bacterium]|jgi:rSAM/selenodomain-associated transferase 1|nr:MAG: TIGR04282 family arsenosugar biosynthesis glycosyltransferase [Thermodesulfobacteriota bacterium]